MPEQARQISEPNQTINVDPIGHVCANPSAADTLPATSRSATDGSTIRLKLTIAYRGTRYHGWQRQDAPPTWIGPTTDARGIPTVQETVETALKEVLRHPLHIQGSSRTDAGVHAHGQVAHVDTIRTTIPMRNLARAVNARLPGDIVLMNVERTHDRFDAIRWTIKKRYTYILRNSPKRDAFHADTEFWRCQHLDESLMHRAALHFVGEHDFSSFARPGHGRETTVRTIFDASCTREGDRVRIAFTGSGFLWNQVRIMVGTLIEIGQGRLDADCIPTILAARDRTRAGPTAPAHGLYLDQIWHHDLPRDDNSTDR
jgi:tRNA pseudouridine38-40 synthase